MCASYENVTAIIVSLRYRVHGRTKLSDGCRVDVPFWTPTAVSRRIRTSSPHYTVINLYTCRARLRWEQSNYRVVRVRNVIGMGRRKITRNKNGLPDHVLGPGFSCVFFLHRSDAAAGTAELLLFCPVSTDVQKRTEVHDDRTIQCISYIIYGRGLTWKWGFFLFFQSFLRS